MPLMKYFGFVGSALVLLLLGLGWYLPQPTAEPVRAGIKQVGHQDQFRRAVT